MKYRLLACLLVALAMGMTTRASLEAQNGAGAPAAREQSAWIGMSFQEENGGGGSVMIVDVVPGAPARDAGLRRGDRILRWNGRTDVAEAVRSVELKPGDEVRLLVAARDGAAEREVSITAAERPARLAVRRGPGDMRVFGDPQQFREMAEALRLNRDSLGIRMDSLNAQLRVLFRDSLGAYFPDGRGGPIVFAPRFREDFETSMRRLRDDVGSLGLALTTGRRAVAGAELTDVTPGLGNYFGTESGALVVRVAPDTPAARSGLRDGDVILSVNGESIENVADLRWRLSQPDTREFALEVLRERARVTVTLGRENP